MSLALLSVLRLGLGLVSQLCPTLCSSTDCNPPGSSVHGILQARILEWVAVLFFRGSSQDLPNPGVKPRSLTLQADSLPFELTGKPIFFQGQPEIRKTQSFYSWSPLKNPHSVCWELKLKREKKKSRVGSEQYSKNE